jgi:hypothetical protein
MPPFAPPLPQPDHLGQAPQPGHPGQPVPPPPQGPWGQPFQPVQPPYPPQPLTLVQPIPPIPPIPPAEPTAPADRWRAAASALLNLGGLGLGFALLRRWRPAVVCWLVTAILLVIALPVSSGGAPVAVVVLYLIFLVGAAVWGALRGLSRPLTWPSNSRAAVGFAVALLVVPVGAVALYNNAHSEAVQRMLLSRLAQADQTIATGEGQSIDTAEPLFTTALATYQDLLDHHRTSRAGKLVPARLAGFYQTVGAPFANGDYCGAVEPLTFLNNLSPQTFSAADLGPWAQWPGVRLETSLLQCGVSLLGGPNGQTVGVVDLNLLLGQDSASTQAGQVPTAVAAVITKAAGGITGSDACTATSGLTTLGTQVNALTSADATITAGLKKDTDTVNGDVESGTFACAVSDYTGGKFSDAETAMNDFVSTYPNDPRKVLAQKYSIAAQIAQQDADAGKVTPTLTSGGSVTVTIYNDSPDAVDMLYTGPATGSVDIAACTSCKIYASDADAAAGDCVNGGTGYPKATFTLPPGTTYFLQTGSGPDVNSSVHSEDYDADSSYSACAYETSVLGGL